MRSAPGEAARAELDWVNRVHQPHDPPAQQARWRFFTRQNDRYIDELDVRPSVRSYMKRAIARSNRGVTPLSPVAGWDPADESD